MAFVTSFMWYAPCPSAYGYLTKRGSPPRQPHRVLFAFAIIRRLSCTSECGYKLLNRMIRAIPFVGIVLPKRPDVRNVSFSRSERFRNFLRARESRSTGLPPKRGCAPENSADFA